MAPPLPDIAFQTDSLGQAEVATSGIGYLLRPTGIDGQGAAVKPGAFPVRVVPDDLNSGFIETAPAARVTGEFTRRLLIKNATPNAWYVITAFRTHADAVVAGPSAPVTAGWETVWDSGQFIPANGTDVLIGASGLAGMISGFPSADVPPPFDLRAFSQVKVTAVAYHATATMGHILRLVAWPVADPHSEYPLSFAQGCYDWQSNDVTFPSNATNGSNAVIHCGPGQLSGLGDLQGAPCRGISTVPQFANIRLYCGSTYYTPGHCRIQLMGHR